jgi:hypothetical protein
LLSVLLDIRLVTCDDAMFLLYFENFIHT